MQQWKFELLMKPPALPLTEGPVWDGELQSIVSPVAFFTLSHLSISALRNAP